MLGHLGAAAIKGFYPFYRRVPFKILGLRTNIISSGVFLSTAQTIRDVCSPIGDFFFLTLTFNGL